MIYLDTPSKKLQIVLAGNVATTAWEIASFFFDQTPQATTTERRGGVQVASSNNTTDVDIVNAPALQGIRRNIHTIFLHNKDTAAGTITVKTDDGGTDTIHVKQSVSAGESLVYEDGAGWQLLSPITPPFSDTTPIVKGSADPTKLVRIEADGVTTATTRVINMPDFDVTLLAGAATQAHQETGTSLVDSVTPGRQHFHPSAPKAWAVFAVNGTIQQSYGVTSITDSGVGDWTVNLSITFAADTFCAMASGVTGAGAANQIFGIDGRTTTTVGIVAFNTSGVQGDGNATHVTFHALGDL